MSRKNRIPKPILRLITDLDSHLFILRRDLKQLGKVDSSLKVITTELRVLVCLSSGTEGLLWRLTNLLNVPDNVFVQTEDFDQDNKFFNKLSLAMFPIRRGSSEKHPIPSKFRSLKHIIRNMDALACDGKVISHEKLIKSISQQMGSAHECDGIDKFLVKLISNKINDQESFIPIIKMDSQLVLEVGERVINHAIKKYNFVREVQVRNQGDLSLVFSYPTKKIVPDGTEIFAWRSAISDVKITARTKNDLVEFEIIKSDKIITVMTSPIQLSRGYSFFTLSYCSSAKKARTLVDNVISTEKDIEGLGWIFSDDFEAGFNPKCNKQCVSLIYEKLISTSESEELNKLPLNGYGLWRDSSELRERGTFPD